MTRLTIRRLEAIIEALTSRLAGEVDIGDEPDAPTPEDYEKALDWAEAELVRRGARGARHEDKS